MMMDLLRHAGRDLRVGARSLLSRPGFSIVAIVTLALGIAVNTAVFSIVNTVLLRPLPFHDAERLVQLETVRGGERGKLSLREVRDIEERTKIFSEVAAFVPGSQYSLAGEGTPEKPQAILMTHNLFRVLGVALQHGETFPEAYDRSRFDAIILSHDLWQRQFGGNPRVIGTTIGLDSTADIQTAYRIFGVLPAGFDFPARTDLYRSLFIGRRFPDHERREARNVLGVARLRDGVSVDEARATVRTIGAQMAEEFRATNTGVELHARTLRDTYVDDVRPYVLFMTAAVALVLLVVCSNLANLLLSRAIGREQEVAIRAALGASRRHIVQQLLAETLLLAAAGGLAGVAIAAALLRALTALVKLDLPSWMRVDLDVRVLVIAAATSILAGLMAGILPAWRTATMAGALGRHARGAIGSLRHQRLRRALIVGEVALSLILLVAAGLMTRTFVTLMNRDVGFRPDSLLTFRLALPVRTPAPQALSFHQRLIERLEALPGVTAAALNANLPLAQVGQPDFGGVAAEGQPEAEAAKNPYVHYQRVTPGYFRVMGLPLLRGRGFAMEDREGAALVAVVSRRLADRLWPGQDPVGKRIVRDSLGERIMLVVVGVAGDVIHDRLTSDPGYAVYLSSAQFTDNWTHFVLHTRIDPSALVPAVREAVWAIDPKQPVFDFQPMQERMLDTVWQHRVAAALLGVFGLLALVLAATGLYGVMAYLVSQRTKEIGLRLALGAGPRRLLGQVLGESLALTGAGLAVGLLGAAVLARMLSGLLFQVSIWDPMTFLIVPIVLLASAAAAALVPAWRAARVDPTLALRTE
jgi:predicted permease